MPALKQPKRREPTQNASKNLWFTALLPFLLTLLFYLPVLAGGFLNWDDPAYITHNPNIRGWTLPHLHWMLTNEGAGFWIPLTWFSLSLDYFIGGLSPFVYHLHNLLLHLINVLLVFATSLRLLEQAEKNEKNGGAPPWAIPAATLCALLFGLHPLRVESVAWASERKDVLSGLFFLTAIWFYLGTSKRSGWRGWPLRACFACFLLSFAAKPMAASLPLVLLLLDPWPLRRPLKNLPFFLLEKLPFLVPVLVEVFFLVLSIPSGGALAASHIFSLDTRLANAIHSVALYLTKTAVPVGLYPFYPFPQNSDLLSPGHCAAVIALLLISYACFHWRAQKPGLGLAWLYFLATLAPALGLIQSGSQAAADRFTYLPSLGPLLLLSASLAKTLLPRRKKIFWAAFFLSAVLLGGMTIRQISFWKNDVSFWERLAQGDPGEPAPRFSLVQAYAESGRRLEALAECDKALALFPKDQPLLWARGILSMGDEKMRESLESIKEK